jgi:hypothetical protein
MSFLKKKPIALLLTVLVVVVSTLLSVHMKLGSKCQSISDGFYDGVEFNGYKQKSLDSHLKNVAAYADGLVTIARNYELDTDDVEDASDALKLALRYSRGDASYIYFEYQELMKAVASLQDHLSRTELSERDADGVAQYTSSLIGAQSAMESAGYNESVREFLRSYDRFPSDILGRLAGVQWPEYFA